MSSVLLGGGGDDATPVSRRERPASGGMVVRREMSRIWLRWCELHEKKSSELFAMLEKGQDEMEI